MKSHPVSFIANFIAKYELKTIEVRTPKGNVLKNKYAPLGLRTEIEKDGEVIRYIFKNISTIKTNMGI
ncbi:hypothetical protein [Defluviitalea phaphyphila]|uniref:hypothetical protein n=1 Tax=Defluviitalea phaphyphila TaxID=1473580 RepID=UPI0007304232|nr:hypothetical protein [Defluviitalea phaphyphila]